MTTVNTATNQEVWRAIFAEGHPQLKSFQRFHNRLPSPPRCKLCFAPFSGIGGFYMRLRGKDRNRRNPQYCNACDKFIQAFPGGAEVDLSMVIVDVRGSVTIGQKMTPAEFNKVMSEFYATTAKLIAEADGFVVDLVGDRVLAVFPPGFCGPSHAKKAVAAAERLLDATDARHRMPFRVPIGVGVHSGPVFIGTVAVGELVMQDVGVAGDNVNIAARLADSARIGEALISEVTCLAAGIKYDNFESRDLMLKGRTTSVRVRVTLPGMGASA